MNATPAPVAARIAYGKREDEYILLRSDGRGKLWAKWHHRIKNRHDELMLTDDEATGPNLPELFAALFNVEPYNPRVTELVEYIRSTEWGTDL